MTHHLLFRSMPRIARPFLLVLLLVSCSPFAEEESAGCTLPPSTFKESDLAGTWVAGLAPLRTDTLIIREDGLYKQIIHVENPPIEYESDWQPWRVEYPERDIPYLHLEGMRLWAYLPYPGLLDEQVVGGGDQWFVDFCSGSVETPDGRAFPGVQMPAGEGILTVTGIPEGLVQPPRGILLSLLPVSDAQSWAYELQQP